jgi:peptide/nickel transport system ATP-binding protein
LLKIENLKKYFPVKAGFIFERTVAYIKAVDDISLEIKENETYGLVGESGCGKTTAGKTVIRLLDPTDGKIVFDGVDIAKLKEKDLKPFRTKMQIVFQDPMSSLNPRMTIGDMLSEPLLFHGIAKNKKEAEKIIGGLLEEVGLKAYHVDRYPHQFSGGQRQRIAIARAISVKPSLIVLDEPTSALDVSVQAQIINLLKRIQEELHAAYIFISHNLAVVRFISDRVGIMYLGRIVEEGDVDQVFENPMHPYTKALLQAAPVPDPRKKRERTMLIGGSPNVINRPNGCFFNPRCKYRMKICEQEYPEFVEVENGHKVACFLYNK